MNKAFFMDLPVSSFVSHSSYSKKCDLVVASDGSLGIVGIFHSGYFDHRDTFQTVLDLYCVTG